MIKDNFSPSSFVCLLTEGFSLIWTINQSIEMWHSEIIKICFHGDKATLLKDTAFKQAIIIANAAAVSANAAAVAGV